MTIDNTGNGDHTTTRRRFLQAGLLGSAAMGLAPTSKLVSRSTATALRARAKSPITLRMLALADPVNLKGLQNVANGFRNSENGKWSHVTIAFDTAPISQLYNKIQTSVAAGGGWDLVQADGPSVKNYAYNKVIRSLAEFFTKSELKQWDKQSVTDGTYRGKFYAPPMMESASVMFYNESLIADQGSKPPASVRGWTMEQALGAWQHATVGSPNPSVWGIWPCQNNVRSDYIAGIFRRGYGGRNSKAFKGIADDGITLSGYFDAPEAIEGMRFYQQLITKYKVSPVDALPNNFTTGKAAFLISPDNTIGAIKAQYPNGGFEYGITGIPYFQHGTQITQTGSWHWAIAPRTSNLKAAVAFVRYAAGEEGSKLLYEAVQQIPANLALLNSLPEYQKPPRSIIRQTLEQVGTARIQTPGYQEFSTICTQANTSIAQGADVAQTMHQAAQQMDTALAKYKGWKA